jgi:hypothetical protein
MNLNWRSLFGATKTVPVATVPDAVPVAAPVVVPETISEPTRQEKLLTLILLRVSHDGSCRTVAKDRIAQSLIKVGFSLSEVNDLLE